MSTRKIIINKNIYYFNFDIFNELFRKKCKKEDIKKMKLELELSKFVNKGSDAIHNWRFKKNGPSDLETINLIANFFEISDYYILLNEKEKIYSMRKLNDLETLSLKRIYDAIIDYLEIFQQSNGFNDYWFDLKEKPSQREGILYDIATKEVGKVELIYKKEYMILGNTKIYEEIGDFIYNDLYDTFDGKLSYAYRFEATPEEQPTTDEDYYKALNKINNIIDKFSEK